MGQENIVSYKDAFFDDKTRCLCIVTECCDGGDLMEQITLCEKIFHSSPSLIFGVG